MLTLSFLLSFQYVSGQCVQIGVLVSFQGVAEVLSLGVCFNVCCHFLFAHDVRIPGEQVLPHAVCRLSYKRVTFFTLRHFVQVLQRFFYDAPVVLVVGNSLTEDEKWAEESQSDMDAEEVEYEFEPETEW